MMHKNATEFFLPFLQEGIIGSARKSRTMNIRIAQNVLKELKRRSEREGIPSQMLIQAFSTSACRIAFSMKKQSENLQG